MPLLDRRRSRRCRSRCRPRSGRTARSAGGIPESWTANSAAATAYWMKGSIFRASFLSDELERVEAADLAGDAGRVAGRVELGQGADAALPGEKGVPGGPRSHAHGRHQADPGDDDASFVVSLRAPRIT